MKGKRMIRIRLAVEFIIEFIRVSEMLPISANGETTIYHVDEQR